MSDLSTQDFILRAVLESPKDLVIFALDREYRYVAFNEAHRREMRKIWDAEIAVGQNMLTEVIGREDDRAKAKAHFDRALSGEHFVVVDAYGHDALSRRVYENSFGPIVDAGGATIGVTVYLTDITEQTQAREELAAYRLRLEVLVDERTRALRESEERYRTLVVNAPFAVLVHAGSSLRYANPAAVSLFGESDTRAVMSRSLDELLGGATLEPPDVENEAKEPRTLVLLGAGRRVDVEYRSLPFEFEGRPATLTLMVDVTARRRAELERRELEERMLHTQKLESLGLLAGGIAHDFNNLLVGILGNADLALRPQATPADVHALLLRIKAASKRAAELTNRMLAYSGKQPFVLRRFDLNEVVKETVELLTGAITGTTVQQFDLLPGGALIEGDATQVGQVVMNLITNAADAISSTRGVITVRTGALDADRTLLSSTYVDDSLKPGPYVFLEVSDNGSGMDDATRAKIFDPFFTTKAKGRGLGLAAVLGIVRAHGGALAVSSEVGVGTTIRILFPRRSAEAAAPVTSPREPATDDDASASVPAVHPPRHHGVVIVADDEPRVRQVVSLMLKDMGFDPIEVDSAKNCLAAFREHRADVALVIADLIMPGGGGLVVARTLRAEGHRVPIVVSSGYSEDVLGPEFRDDPCMIFLEKPFGVRPFQRAVSTAVERGAQSGWGANVARS